MDREQSAHGASRRATSELALARDVRLGPWASLIAGAFIGWLAIFAKAALSEAVGDDSGYILLMAAAVAAAWIGGLIGGLTATAVAFILDSVIFLGGGAALLSPDRAELTRQGLFAIVAIGTVVLVGSRRASRDRLADALDEAAALAEEVAGRDDRLELMLAASGTGFWEWDLVSNDLVWSDAIFEQHGLELAESPPDFVTYLETIHPDDREAFQAGIAAAIAGQRAFDMEVRILWPDGSTHWTRGSGRVFRDADGQAVRMLGTGQDVTERRRIEDQRDQFALEERRAGEFREAFIDVISHELRTPVTTILGAAQILARASGAGEGSERDSLLVDIHLEAERLHRLVEDLLILTRAERGRLVVEAEPLAVERLLERVVANIGRELPTIDVTLDLDGALPIVAGESTYVEQVLRNLLGNAAKYSPPGTPVVVAAAPAEDSVEIRVLDSGPGIPEGSEARLFELFYRSPEHAKLVAGSGIGLYVCASLVEAMGGRIWATSRPSGGAEFGFTLRVLEGDDDGYALDDERMVGSAVRSGTAATANALSRQA